MSRILLLVLALGCLCVSGMGAQDLATEKAGPRWPSPPEPTRVIFERMVASPADMGIKASWWKHLVGGVDPCAMEQPVAVLTGADGQWWIADLKGGLLSYDPAGRKALRQRESQAGSLVSPVALLADGPESLLVADSGLGVVLKYDKRLQGGRVVCQDLARPTSLAWTRGKDTLLVADAGANEVLRLDRSGRKLPGAQWDSLAVVMNTPTHLAQRHGCVVITDSFNSRLLIADSAGELVRAIGQPGSTPGSFARPKGVALDSRDDIYVADALFGNIQVFDSTGRLLLFFGENGGAGPGGFNLPGGLTVDEADRLYVADTWNGRVQVFQLVHPEERP